MLLDIQGDMEAIKNTKKQMEKLLNNDETLEDILEKSKKLNITMKEIIKIIYLKIGLLNK